MENITAQDVIDFLEKHPRFFLQHEDLLATLEMPPARNKVVSLSERQLVVLREENQQLQRQLVDLISIAKSNEALNKRIQCVIVSLASADSAETFFAQLYEVLKIEFNTDAIAIRLFNLPPASLSGREEFVEYDAQVFSLFESLLSSDVAVCGQLLEEQKHYLFDNKAIASAVLIPISQQKSQGILALGSYDVTRFHEGMSTDLLKYMGDLISQLLYIWLRY